MNISPLINSKRWTKEMPSVVKGYILHLSPVIAPNKFTLYSVTSQKMKSGFNEKNSGDIYWTIFLEKEYAIQHCYYLNNIWWNSNLSDTSAWFLYPITFDKELMSPHLYSLLQYYNRTWPIIAFCPVLHWDGNNSGYGNPELYRGSYGNSQNHY